MQLIYAVDLDVRGAQPASERFGALLEHLAVWLTGGSGTPITVDELGRSGEITLEPHPSRRHSVTRTLRWENLRGTNARAMRLSLRQQAEAEVVLATQVTFTAMSDGSVRARIGIGREMTGEFLSPALDASVFQPGLLTELARDDRLELFAGSQRVDSRYLPIRTPQEARVVGDLVDDARRLPIVLIHVRSPDTFELARVLSAKLIGLARIITLNHHTSSELSRQLPRIAVPFGGALLVWSDINARTIQFTASRIEEMTAEGVRAHLMSRLAAVSALARGTDRGWRTVQNSAQAERRLALETVVEEAVRSNDYHGEISALRSQVEELRTEATAALALAEEYEQRVTDAETLANLAEIAEQSANYWREQYESIVSTVTIETVADVWASVPTLVAGASPAPTFRALEDAAKQHIAFTDAAERSWKSIAYPDPSDMTDKLVRLARASEELYEVDHPSMGRIADWFYEAYGLKVAMSDQTLSRNARLREFDFDGRRHSQIPHIKVRDGVKPNEVGRIHFDFDADVRRIVVNHVALKLHGI